MTLHRNSPRACYHARESTIPVDDKPHSKERQDASQREQDPVLGALEAVALDGEVPLDAGLAHDALVPQAAEPVGVRAALQERRRVLELRQVPCQERQVFHVFAARAVRAVPTPQESVVCNAGSCLWAVRDRLVNQVPVAPVALLGVRREAVPLADAPFGACEALEPGELIPPVEILPADAAFNGLGAHVLEGVRSPGTRRAAFSSAFRLEGAGGAGEASRAAVAVAVGPRGAAGALLHSVQAGEGPRAAQLARVVIHIIVPVPQTHMQDNTFSTASETAAKRAAESSTASDDIRCCLRGETGQRTSRAGTPWPQCTAATLRHT